MPNTLELLPDSFDQKTITLPKFMEDIKNLGEKNQSTEAAKELIKLLEEDILDFGTSKYKYVEIEPGKVIESEGAPLLTRSSLIRVIQERFKTPEEAKNNFTIFEFDLKNFRDADKARDLNNHSSADVIANMVAENLNSLVSELPKNKKLSGVESVPGRIGGDEFGILVCGKLKTEQKELIKKLIGEKITNIKGWFMDENEEPKLENLELKKPVEEITFPNDVKKARVFWEYLNKGVILNEDDIAKENSGYSEKKSDDLVGSKKDSDVETNIQHLLKKSPRFNKHFELLNKISGKDDSHLRQELYNLITYSVFDRLLGENVSDAKKFAYEFINNPPKRINIIEVQGIKEQNDCNSLSTGDEAIVGLWNKVALIIGDSKNNGEVKIYRRGSTFLIAEWGEKIMDENKIEALSRIKNVVVKGIEMPVGFYSISSDHYHSAKDETEVRGFIDKIFKQCTLEGYAKNVFSNLENPDVFKPVEKVALPAKLANQTEFIQTYFWGKRSVERGRLMLETLEILEKLGNKELNEKIRPLREIFKN